MREPKLLSEGPLDPATVDTSGRKRPFSEAAVQAIMASYNALGIIQHPIAVRKVKHQGGALKLIAGLHRIEACTRLEIDVPSKVYDCSDDWAEMLELDDNLAGADLTALDTAVFLADRKRLYEKLHPETKADAFKGNRHTGSLAADMMSFTSVTAEKFGLTDRHVRRLVAAGTALDARAIQLLRAAPKPVALSDLQEISKIGDADERAHVVLSLSGGNDANAKAARRAYAVQRGQRPAPAQTANDAGIKKLLDVWGRASQADRNELVMQKRAEIEAILERLS